MKYRPEEEDEFLARLSVLEFILGVKHSIATLTKVFRFLHVLHEVLVRRTCRPNMQQYINQSDWSSIVPNLT